MQLEGLCDLLPEEVCISAAGQQTFPVSQSVALSQQIPWDPRWECSI